MGISGAVTLLNESIATIEMAEKRLKMATEILKSSINEDTRKEADNLVSINESLYKLHTKIINISRRL